MERSGKRPSNNFMAVLSNLVTTFIIELIET